MKNGLFQDIILLMLFGLKRMEIGSIFQLIFDLELNTIVAKELIDSETVDTIYNFLNQSLRNQKTECIITDLKSEYRVAIDRLHIKTTILYISYKTINKTDKLETIITKKNNTPEEEIEIILEYKRLFFDIIGADSIR